MWLVVQTASRLNVVKMLFSSWLYRYPWWLVTKTMASYSSATGLSQARWFCCDSKAGFSRPGRKVHAFSALGIASSSKDYMNSGMMACWRSCVDAADAKKAECASIFARLIQVHHTWQAKMPGATVCRSSHIYDCGKTWLTMSNSVRSGLSKQSDVRRRYINFGMLRLFFSRTNASWEWMSDYRSKAFCSCSILCMRATLYYYYYYYYYYWPRYWIFREELLLFLLILPPELADVNSFAVYESSPIDEAFKTMPPLCGATPTMPSVAEVRLYRGLNI